MAMSNDRITRYEINWGDKLSEMDCMIYGRDQREKAVWFYWNVVKPTGAKYMEFCTVFKTEPREPK